MCLFSWVAAATFTIFHLEASFKREWRHMSSSQYTLDVYTPDMWADSSFAGQVTITRWNVLLCETQPVPSFTSQSCCLRLGSCEGQVWACSCQAPKPPKSLSRVPRTEKTFFFLLLFNPLHLPPPLHSFLRHISWVPGDWTNLNKHNMSFGLT